MRAAHDWGVKCWGDGAQGQLGNGEIEDESEPVDVVGLSSGVSAIATGHSHACALLENQGVKCWGLGQSGQLGNGDAESDSSTPVDVLGLSDGISAIAAGGYHACALLEGGAAKCWGAGQYSQLGNGAEGNRAEPVDVAGLP